MIKNIFLRYEDEYKVQVNTWFNNTYLLACLYANTEYFITDELIHQLKIEVEERPNFQDYLKLKEYLKTHDANYLNNLIYVAVLSMENKHE